MTKPELMKQLEAAVDEAIGRRQYCSIEITFKAGEPEMLRHETTFKLNGGNEQSRACKPQR